MGRSRGAPVLLTLGLVAIVAGFVLALHNPVIHDAAGKNGASCLAPYDVVINGAEREMPSGPYSEPKNQDLCHHAGVTHFYAGVGALIVGGLCWVVAAALLRRSRQS